MKLKASHQNRRARQGAAPDAQQGSSTNEYVPKTSRTAIAVEDISRAILVLPGHRALLDAELTAVYGVDTRVLLQAVRRNRERFPEDFMMQLTVAEWTALRSQIVTLKRGRGGGSGHWQTIVQLAS
jgi:hypothetical protein